MRDGSAGRVQLPWGVPWLGAWIVLARFPAALAVPVAFVAFAVAVGTALWSAPSLVERSPAVRSPLIAAVALEGLAMGTALGFSGGTGKGLVLWWLAVWASARAAWIATMIVATRPARPRAALYGWRRVLVVHAAVAVPLWLLVAASGAAEGADRFFDQPLDLSAVALLLLGAVSVFGEGILQYRAGEATRAWLASPLAPSRPLVAPRPPLAGESVLPYGPPRPPDDAAD